MRKSRGIIIRTSLMILPIIFFASTLEAFETNNPTLSYDSTYRYGALENKVNFSNTEGEIIAFVEENTIEENIIVENTIDEDNMKKLEELTEKQKVSIEKSNQAMESIEGRNGLRIFLLGNSIGVLKFQAAQIQDHIYALSVLSKKVNDGRMIVQISNLVDTLDAQQAKINKFILDHEDGFSLFGWFVASL